jgi:hypothetical protein
MHSQEELPLAKENFVTEELLNKPDLIAVLDVGSRDWAAAAGLTLSPQV